MVVALFPVCTEDGDDEDADVGEPGEASLLLVPFCNCGRADAALVDCARNVVTGGALGRSLAKGTAIKRI